MNREVGTIVDPRHVVSPEEWGKLSKSLAVEEAALRAVAEVESAGSGFLPDGLPKILFEGHAFHRLTGGRFDSEEDISYPRWDKSKYKGGRGEWTRLTKAAALDRAAALQSASWGMFQLMGFNYGLCGYHDVEAFVSDHHKSADEHLKAFARFIGRPQFLTALRKKDWATFARHYNGAGYAANAYDKKMSRAYERWCKVLKPDGKGATPKVAAKPQAAEPYFGRESFDPIKPERRQARKVRNVRPDPVDLRDWPYRPNISIAPPDRLAPWDPRPIKQQANTNACVGFALATVIEYLLDRAGDRPAELISGYMIYSMARRYDEWTESAEEVDEGSSLRGALKGWSKHGACCDRMWTEPTMPAATNEENSDWWLDAVRRPMGAYYRIGPDNIRDMHIALRETGVLYASAFNHAGWDALMRAAALPIPLDIDELAVIEHLQGAKDLGHAFAIVGYTKKGFIVQNSWGEEWGHSGFAILTYDDWLQNAMDCWVVQLGVVTEEHNRVATQSSLRYDEKTGAAVSRNTILADHEIGPFVVDMENEGWLSSKGRFRTDDKDLASLVDFHLPAAAKQWGCGRDGVLDVAIYAHGGLNDEDAAAAAARKWVPFLYSNKIFPIFLMWETGAWKTICNIFEDAVEGEAKAGGRFREWINERIEGLARLPGRKLWSEMKQNADALSLKRKNGMQPGVVKLFEAFRESQARTSLPKRIRLHLIGHSAGAIVHTWLGSRAFDTGFEVATISLLAPAVRIDTFHKQLGREIVDRDIKVFIAHLTDTTERADETCKPYGHSLLYLVSRAFEDAVETPILGMERHIVAALPTMDWAGNVTRLRSPGGLWKTGARVTRATSHGGMDDDVAIREAVADFIRTSG